MKVPLRWLSDYVSLPDSVPQLAERLTLAGLEVASVRALGLPLPEGLKLKTEEIGPVWARDKIVVAEVLRVEPHPDADKLKLPTVGYGPGLTKRMVTGAPNLAVGDAGQKVVVALAGAVLFDGHAAEKVLKELKPAKIRGIPSDAMVCSNRELGIADDHEGIIILEPDAPVGTPLADFMGDLVLEIDVLPNMARCLCMIGMAREVAALTGNPLKLPSAGVQSSGEAIEGKVKVVIENPRLSARYLAMLLRDVKIGPAPGWMQRRLLYAGMRPINNLVDITNYVMLEWGQPLHAFDYDKLVARAGDKPPTITVRPARAGEVLITLDNNKRTLTPDHLVIADEAGPIALAGVMGGLETEVTATTKNVLLESASFDFVSIRRTMKTFNLPSEASVRFSKGVHPELVKPAAERAADLMRQFAGASVCRGAVDNYAAPLPPQVVSLEMTEVRRQLGVDLPVAEIERILTALEFKVEKAGTVGLRATVPAHRLDIQAGAADLIEEVARIYGYDRLPATLLAEPLPRQQANVPLLFEERVRDLLVGAGLHEGITYSLTTPEREAPLGLPLREYITLLNPISSERAVMRQSVLAGLLDVAEANLRHEGDVRLFELGSVYLTKAGEKLPEEPRRLALALCGKRGGEFWADFAVQDKAQPLDFFDLKGIIEALLEDLHIPEPTYRPGQAAYLHPGRAAEAYSGTTFLGSFGLLHPRVAAFYKLEGKSVLVGELDVEALQAVTPSAHLYQPVPTFPAALRDVAIVVSEEITAERVHKEIRAAGGELLRAARLFDVYRGESIAAGTKSLAYALTYQAVDRTLADKEIDKAHKKIEDRLKHVLKAQIRGQ